MLQDLCVFGAGYHVLPIWKKRLDAKTLVTTPNSDVIYAMSYVGLGQDGPLVFEAPPTADTSRIGPQVGATVPAFSGTDQFGTPHALASSYRPKGTMLGFFRSADPGAFIVDRQGIVVARFFDVSRGHPCIGRPSPERRNSIGISADLSHNGALVTSWPPGRPVPPPREDRGGRDG